MSERAGERKDASDATGATRRTSERGAPENGEAVAGGSEARENPHAVRASELVEANERLVIAALRAEEIAENATSELSNVVGSSQRDALTGTPNRTLMLDRMTNALAMARRHGNRVALLFLDLDRFKEINDTLGHAAGDEALRTVARRLKALVRESDTVSRHGGDEFLVLLTEVSSVSDATLIAQKMRSSLDAPIHLGGQMVRLSASIGIAVYPEDGMDPQILIAQADAAMYIAKKTANSHLPPPTGRFAPQPSPARGETLPSHDRELREANEELVLAALSAQELQAVAEAAKRHHIAIFTTLAHELRNPLEPVRNAVALLKRVGTGADKTVLPKVQAILERQLTHLARLVDDLLDGARAVTGKFRIERYPVEMAVILNQAVESCRPAMEQRQQHCGMQLPERDLRVFGDLDRLVQVFVNLLQNASKYTHEGGEITISVATVGAELAVTVADSGVGISAESLPHIFDLFVQDTTIGLASSNDGLGIGLAVVRELVEAHGGSVTASSAGRNAGSNFVVTLPLLGESADAGA